MRTGTAVVTVLGLLTAGCGGGTNAQPTTAPTGPATTVTSTRPAPVRTIVRSGPVVSAGRTIVVHAQSGVSLRIRAAHPRTSTTRLSSSYGYPPQHGYYVTFSVAIVDTGRRPVLIRTDYFYVRIPGQGKVHVEDGNAPYSGASAQLDNTQLDPGQSDHGPLTFDVARPHGRLVFAPDGSPAVTWLF